jgi:hypothetical protein
VHALHDLLVELIHLRHAKLRDRRFVIPGELVAGVFPELWMIEHVREGEPIRRVLHEQSADEVLKLGRCVRARLSMPRSCIPEGKGVSRFRQY